MFERNRVDSAVHKSVAIMRFMVHKGERTR